MVATVVCFFAVLALRPIAVNWGLVDTPDNRKKHTGNVPLVGGLAIYLATMTSVSLYLESSQHINLILVSVSLIVLIGALDDRYDLSAKIRLVAQILIASILVFGTGIHIASLGDLFGSGVIMTGSLSGVISILAIVAGINAFNMTDGIDGLAGTLALISLIAIGLLIKSPDFILLTGAMSAAIVVFLFFNLSFFTNKNKVFMGDAGSMMLGLTVSWLLIVFSQPEGQSLIPPAHALWFIAVPLIDMLAVMFRRLRRGQSPLVADREHLHHVFMDIGLNSRQALIFISIISLAFCFIGYVMTVQELPEYLSLIMISLTFFIYNYLLSLRHRFKKK
ncbi:undecaprenyl-phosphate alpha-N-acetylglucosaminyl 1-phosphate transferase [Kangiella sp. HZ709]|uniref:undecaprenyl-phosphate alpha-N-acetylglucosaminyl 1-phosphate transferase n=1 Tax=Kangiella sp. HZ709 TaxID=2666328 RepID=UPI0018A1CF58|nr:undecaprenyl-phosphate alpha-N-acetylglucosaminyl 1-phosphate transferase [Kangiella sp. HZ709]